MRKDHTIIIAEAGVNHNGDLQMALQLVDAAAEAGADIVKFQTFKAKNIVTVNATRALYQIENMSGEEISQFKMLEKLELSDSDHIAIMNRCKERGIEFLSTPFDLESIDFLAHLGLNTWKIPSGEITNYFMLKEIAKHNGNVILSTGMSTIDEISEALEVLKINGQNPERVTLLHCTTQYPTPMEDVNLRALITLRDIFHLSIGYSDHTQGIEIPIAAVAVGASVIEKHFTLSRELPGPDHKASLEPSELKQMINAIRNIEKGMGDGRKRVTESEKSNRGVARKSLVASKPIRRGEILTEENVTAKRPGNGISPMKWIELSGSVAKRDYNTDDQIEL
ncbi:MAG: N-acetylneuraminate synthase [Prevotella sp.]|nr:N-acetylneuraminate synthase [Bacteroides sp.]MCM1366304.1 N-acetylneuraminate synthase [Prevotella sp.]MCM1437108.1 N-acetylneuraminate synthase [Prevotella sp.]